MIAVTYHADVNEVQGDAALARLLSAPAQTAPFDRLAWWHGLAAHCGVRALLAVARDGADIAVLPLAQADGGLVALANYYSFWTRPIVSPGGNFDALLGAIARDLARRGPRVTLAPLPQADGTTLARAFRRAGWLVDLTVSDTNHYLDVEARSYAQYLATRPGALRTTLRRKAGKLASAVHRGFSPEAWAQYDAVYRASWKPQEGSPEFLRAFAEAEGAAGRLRLGIALAGDTPVAAQLWTVESGTAFIHKLAYAEVAKPLSPGTALSAAMFAHVIDIDRIATVDFGTGDDAYKRDWMEAARPRVRLTALRPENPRNWPQIARIAARRLAGRGGRG